MSYDDWKTTDRTPWPEDEPCPTCDHAQRYHEIREEDLPNWLRAKIQGGEDVCPDCTVCEEESWRKTP